MVHSVFKAGVEKALQPHDQPRPAEQEKKKTHVFLAIPTISSVDIRWTLALHKVLDASSVATIPLTYAADWKYGVAESREKLVEAALATESVTHVMFWDSDILPERIDVIAQLLAVDAPIVSGIYCNSVGSGINAWISERTIALKQPANVVQVDKVGLGLCMIRREVFEAIKERPLFYMKSYGGADMKGEDFHFFELAAKAGFKPSVDMRIRAKHLKMTPIDVDGSVSSG